MDARGLQGNGLARMLLRTVERTLHQAGVQAATMPAIVAAADESKQPPPATAPLPDDLTGSVAGHTETVHSFIPGMGSGASLGSGGEPSGDVPLHSCAGNAYTLTGSPQVPHANAWGCKVCAGTCHTPHAMTHQCKLCAWHFTRLLVQPRLYIPSNLHIAQAIAHANTLVVAPIKVTKQSKTVYWREPIKS